MNPYADQLTFLDDKTRTRRDHEKYLGLIDVVALLHQYQREIKRESWEGDTIEYIEVTLEDIATANKLAHDVLGRTLDELPPQTRKLLTIITGMVKAYCEKHQIKQSDYRFSRKDVRAYSAWGNTQLKIHLRRLEEMEYLIVHRGKRGQTFEYELLYDGELNDQQHLMGLIDVKKLGYDEKKSGVNNNKAGSGRPVVGAKSGVGRSDKNNKNPINTELNGNQSEIIEKSTSYKKIKSSHRSDMEVMA